MSHRWQFLLAAVALLWSSELFSGERPPIYGPPHRYPFGFYGAVARYPFGFYGPGSRYPHGARYYRYRPQYLFTNDTRFASEPSWDVNNAVPVRDSIEDPYGW